VLRLVQSEEPVDCLATLEVVLGSGLQWQWPWGWWREWREWEWGGGDVRAPLTTFAYHIQFVLAPALVLATSNLRFNLSITNGR
jgi:hypothetical protein